MKKIKQFSFLFVSMTIASAAHAGTWSVNTEPLTPPKSETPALSFTRTYTDYWPLGDYDPGNTYVWDWSPTVIGEQLPNAKVTHRFSYTGGTFTATTTNGWVGGVNLLTNWGSDLALGIHNQHDDVENGGFQVSAGGLIPTNTHTVTADPDVIQQLISNVAANQATATVSLGIGLNCDSYVDDGVTTVTLTGPAVTVQTNSIGVVTSTP